jgi:CheY-like chemotaxis protein
MEEKRKKKILLVDDEESITRTLKLFLDRSGGFEVRTENKGSQAVRVARDFRPDLIVLDVIMPDADGGAIAQDLGEDPDLQSIPIVFLTAIIREGDRGPRTGNRWRCPYLPCQARGARHPHRPHRGTAGSLDRPTPGGRGLRPPHRPAIWCVANDLVRCQRSLSWRLAASVCHDVISCVGRGRF